ncbi:hypothetical protein CP967_31230 [Streptomyces nitrosporeus]|uniref:Uncharacterized protein n=1 Tax=Streptomyces nitrosporeus TaxID=28894 RepID=A0A5J6FLJ8_9ACTN|nr:hypothetical protein [Streptomyces nitrosporeus]QEU75845.1 hypothetical protein CP967_31230 [Streptomyces nitrosporeus]GGY88728.1 hypothetical protein GCM10010327_19320 [Streptomyces nitrosporeus]
MSDTYLDASGDQWFWDAENEGYYVNDGHYTRPLDEIRRQYGPLQVRDAAGQWIPEPGYDEENLIRRIIREELERRFGRLK